jgi:DNA-directed RNA polymerase subunit RPC12/RpoP
MPEVLKCPTCAAPLDYPAAGGSTMRCPYCNSTVMLTDPSKQPASISTGDDLAAALGPLLGNAMNIPEVADLLRSGKKIQAIKIIRQSSGLGLAEAKNAVDKIAAARSAAGIPIYNSSAATKVVASGLKFGFGLALTIIIFTVVIVSMVTRSIRKQVAVSTPSFTPPVITLPAAFAPAPAVPTFAHMTMEFGSEGIGAGQFKDSRSVAVSGDGHIYVGEYSDGRIQVFDSAGKFAAEWSIGKGKYLSNLTADHHGNVYVVADSHIYRYQGATGMPLDELENQQGDNVIDYSDAFAALNGDVYALTENSDIVDIGPDGKIKSTISATEKVGEDVSFEKIAVLPTGEIYTLSRTSGVFKFAPDGRYINRFGGRAEDYDPANPTPGQLISPNNLAIDGKGRIYVSDDGPAIHVFDSEGHYIDSFGGRDVCFGITVTDQNEILGCFRNKHSIQKFELDKP